MSVAGNPAYEQLLGLCQNIRGFDIRGIPYVYINCEIQGMLVIWLKRFLIESKTSK